MGANLIVQDEGRKANPIVCKSGILLYWGITQVAGGMWASIIGSLDAKKGRAPWTVVGLSFDQQTAATKARERALLEAQK